MNEPLQVSADCARLGLRASAIIFRNVRVAEASPELRAEIAQEIQGPYAGLFLADMGAEVIKVEMRDIGDLSRY